MPPKSKRTAPGTAAKPAARTAAAGRGRAAGGARRRAAGAPPSRAQAAETLRKCEAAWSDFRVNGGLLWVDYFTRSVDYLKNIVDGDSTPTDWMKDGLALYISYYSGVRRVVDLTRKLYSDSASG
jgi:hypothetical protein